MPDVFLCRPTLTTRSANETRVSRLPSVMRNEKSPSETKCHAKKASTATEK